MTAGLSPAHTKNQSVRLRCLSDKCHKGLQCDYAIDPRAKLLPQPIMHTHNGSGISHQDPPGLPLTHRHTHTLSNTHISSRQSRARQLPPSLPAPHTITPFTSSLFNTQQRERMRSREASSSSSTEPALALHPQLTHGALPNPPGREAFKI